MVFSALAGLSLIVSVSIQPGANEPQAFDPSAPPHMSERQKSAIMRPLFDSATQCVAREVAADPRFGKAAVTDLIVDSFPSCLDPVRSLIDAHDRHYGAGTGERFFMGPYLDALPTAVIGLVGDKPK